VQQQHQKLPSTISFVDNGTPFENMIKLADPLAQPTTKEGNQTTKEDTKGLEVATIVVAPTPTDGMIEDPLVAAAAAVVDKSIMNASVISVETKLTS
jgi:hypothetical protein